jgi:hypothetical protein
MILRNTGTYKAHFCSELLSIFKLKKSSGLLPNRKDVVQSDNVVLAIAWHFTNSQFKSCHSLWFCAVLTGTRQVHFCSEFFLLLSSRSRFSKPKRLLEGSNFQSSNVMERTRIMMYMIVCFNIEYTLLLLHYLQDTRRPMKMHFQLRAQAWPPKGRGRTSRYNSVHSLSNPPLRVFYEPSPTGIWVNT